MTRDDTRLSKVVAHALRHDPAAHGLDLDDEGWVDVDELVRALRRRGGSFGAVDATSLERMIGSAAKRRFEMQGARIRALYGHSLPGGVVKRPATRPPRLFHGTTPDALAAIESDGLRPTGRQFVHLSLDRATARAVAGRRTSSPVVLTVDAEAAAASGVHFYEGNRDTWLADGVAARFLTREA